MSSANIVVEGNIMADINNDVDFDLQEKLSLNESQVALEQDQFYPPNGNCSDCLNELCIPEEDYKLYKTWVSVDSFETVLITLHIIVFLSGIIGNLLVSLINIK